ncbi:hypothetical protein MKZ38_005074 [Zalerion maritima]|uniref:RRM domain-containing protein n=1 Tax=Zalerion maritima TaxID=339359 RepID=A0AAD5WP68_9PEZI|nr:hypothetical protein MKZ38_005074 [Zalerion maritima]
MAGQQSPGNLLSECEFSDDFYSNDGSTRSTPTTRNSVNGVNGHTRASAFPTAGKITAVSTYSPANPPADHGALAVSHVGYSNMNVQMPTPVGAPAQQDIQKLIESVKSPPNGPPSTLPPRPPASEHSVLSNVNPFRSMGPSVNGPFATNAQSFFPHPTYFQDAVSRNLNIVDVPREDVNRLYKEYEARENHYRQQHKLGKFPDYTRLIIKDVNRCVTKREIFGIFCCYGQIAEIRPAAPSQPYAFVQFENIEQAREALNHKRHETIELDGRVVKIQMCDPKGNLPRENNRRNEDQRSATYQSNHEGQNANHGSDHASHRGQRGLSHGHASPSPPQHNTSRYPRQQHRMSRSRSPQRYPDLRTYRDRGPDFRQQWPDSRPNSNVQIIVTDPAIASGSIFNVTAALEANGFTTSLMHCHDQDPFDKNPEFEACFKHVCAAVVLDKELAAADKVRLRTYSYPNGAGEYDRHDPIFDEYDPQTPIVAARLIARKRKLQAYDIGKNYSAPSRTLASHQPQRLLAARNNHNSSAGHHAQYSDSATINVGRSPPNNYPAPPHSGLHNTWNI